MIGVVIVSHENIAKEFLKVLEHIVGKQERVFAISIFPDDDMEKKRNQILELVKKAETGSGVIVLTDMFGGTPSNLAISMLREGKVEVLAGVNLPMLIKLAEARKDASLSDAAQKAKDAGQRYIAIASQILAGKT